MNLSFSRIRCAIDILRGRMPGALAMLKADDIAISTHSLGDDHWCQVTFWFGSDGHACGNAYRSVERLYEMNRVQDVDAKVRQRARI